jgi:hypothetical protein
VSQEKNLKLFNHGLNHLNSVSDRTLELEYQLVEFFSQLLGFFLVRFRQQFALDLLLSGGQPLDQLVLFLNLS